MMSEDYKDELLRKGWYVKPHGLVYMAEEKLITKSEYILLDLLLHLENHFRIPRGGWFFHSDYDMAAKGLISARTLPKARDGLRKKGLIYFKQGHSHKATEYIILIDGKYRGAKVLRYEYEV